MLLVINSTQSIVRGGETSNGRIGIFKKTAAEGGWNAARWSAPDCGVKGKDVRVYHKDHARRAQRHKGRLAPARMFAWHHVHTYSSL